MEVVGLLTRERNWALVVVLVECEFVSVNEMRKFERKVCSTLVRILSENSAVHLAIHFFYLSSEFLSFFLSSDESWKLKLMPESCDEASFGSMVFSLEMAPV